MIVDSMPLAGGRGRITSATDAINLAIDRLGVFGPVADGVALEIDGLAVYFEGANLSALLATGPAPLFTIELHKEVLPGLFLDPYRHRMHTIGGREDFLAGSIEGGSVLAVDGRDTLVSEDSGTVSWTSAVYRMRAPADFGAAAWELAPSRKAVGFDYGLAIDLWTEGSDPDGEKDASRDLALPGTAPDAARVADQIDWPQRIIAYQLHFVATVSRPDRMTARSRLDQTAGVGRPLLRTVALAETVEHAHAYHSLLEVRSASVEATFYPETGTPRGFGATIAFTARLEENETVTIRLDPGFAADWFEARLVGVEHHRPALRATPP